MHPSLNRSWPMAAARRAFTLIELLVVVAIIAILAALLVPAIIGAKESSRSTVCLSNLHQFAIATMNYTMDHEGNVPGFWTWLHKENQQNASVTNGSLFPYIKSQGVYYCPTDKLAMDAKPSRLPRGAVSTHRQFSYAMNCGICHTTDMATFLEPAKTMIYMEAVLDPNDYSGMTGPERASSGLALRHHKHGHLVMGDLRVENMTTNDYKQVKGTKRFWFPNNSADTMGFAAGLR